MLEKSRLRQHLVMQKLEINAEISMIKERLEPVTRVLSFLGVFKKKDLPEREATHKYTTRSLIKLGANAGMEIVGQSILYKAGWITRILVPLLLRGITSTVVDKVRKRFHLNGRTHTKN